MIAAGIGCKRGAPASDIEAAIRAALTRAQIGADALDVVATIEGKSAEVGIRVAAEKFGASASKLIVPRIVFGTATCALAASLPECAP